MQRTKPQLLAEVDALGIRETIIPSYPERTGGRDITVDDIIKALQKHFGRDEHPLYKRMPDWTSPMLAEQVYNTPEQAQKDVWQPGQYLLQTKFDGARALVLWTGKGWHLYGRGLSVTNYLPIDYAQNVWIFQKKPDGTPYFHPGTDADFMIDCEIMSRQSEVDTGTVITVNKLQATCAMLGNELNAAHIVRLQELDKANLDFHPFDCVYLNGTDLRKEPYSTRWTTTEQLVDQLQKMMGEYNWHSKFTKVQTLTEHAEEHERKKFYSHQLAFGEEGCIAKDINAPYNSTKNRNSAMVKLKKSVNDQAKLAFGMEDIDGFITGFELGKKGKKYEQSIKILHVSVWIIDQNGNKMFEEPQVLAHISNFSDAAIEDLTFIDPETKEVMLNPRYYGRCCSLIGQDISPRSKHLTHARMIQWKDDKQSQDCTFPMSLLSFHRDRPMTADI